MKDTDKHRCVLCTLITQIREDYIDIYVSPCRLPTCRLYYYKIDYDY